MATDFLLAGYAALKALLLADAQLRDATLGVKQWVWFDVTGDPMPEKEMDPNGGTGSDKPFGKLPELKLDWMAQTDTLRTSTPTFGNVNDGTAAFVAGESHEYAVTITVNDSLLSRTAYLLNAVKRCLRDGATVNVGTDAVARVGQLKARNEKTYRKEAAGTYRRIATITVPVTIAYQGTGQRT